MELEFILFKDGISQAQWNFRYFYKVGDHIFTTLEEAYDQRLKEIK